MAHMTIIKNPKLTTEEIRASAEDVARTPGGLEKLQSIIDRYNSWGSLNERQQHVVAIYGDVVRQHAC